MTHGAEAEALAARYLEAQGLTVVTRNYRCRAGEIDIVARDRDAFVFVEVRLRRGDRFGGAAASITAAKRQRMRAAANHFLARLGREPPCRFDAVVLKDLGIERLEWLRNIEVE